MKKITKFLALGVLIIMIVGLFIGCTSKEKLSDEQIANVKQTRFEYYSQKMPTLTLDDVYFYYYGTFNESIVIMFSPNSGGRMLWHDIFDIVYPNTSFIEVWNNGVLYRLDEALNKGLLTEKNVKQIAKIHSKEYDNIYNSKNGCYK